MITAEPINSARLQLPPGQSVPRLASPSNPIRVLAIIPRGSPIASFIFARRQVASLRDVGVLCETFFLASRTSPKVMFNEWRRLRMAIRTFRPELIHAHYGTVTACFAGVSSMIPLVITYRGSDLNPAAEINWVRQVLGRLLSQIAALRARQIICVSEQLRKRLWWQQHCATVIPTGVDTEAFHPRPRCAARADLKWDNTERVVLFNAGRSPKTKRLDLARASVDVARKLCGDIRFVVLDGDVPPEVVPVMMAGADCLLLTSDWEGSPTVVQEAMACDLPVVAVDVGDVRLRLADVLPSFVVGRNSEEIGRALALILTQGKRSNGNIMAKELSNGVLTGRVVSVYRSAIQHVRPQDFSRDKGSPELHLARTGIRENGITS